MALNIPNVGNNFDTFAKGSELGSNIMQRMLMNPYDMRLKQAQTEHANAQAQQSQMLAGLLGGGMPNGATNADNGTPNPSNPTGAQQNMDMNKALMLAGALRLPTHVVNGNLITPFGTFKVDESKQEARKAATQEKGAEKTLESTAASSLGGLGVNASFKALDTIMEDPSYKNIAGTLEGKMINAQPWGIPVGAMLQKNFPNKFSEQDAILAGEASTHLGNIVTGVAAKFKGPFRQMVNGIINNMKPNMGDSIPMQKSKVKAWRELSDLADKQNGAIAKYINEGMDPTEAILKVAHENDFPSQLATIQKQTAPKNNGKGMVVLYKNGKEYHLPPNLMNKALNEGGFNLGN